jgi:hypothetical protein
MGIGSLMEIRNVILCLFLEILNLLEAMMLFNKDSKGLFILGKVGVVQIEKWYPACRMRAIGSGVPSTK